MLNFWVLLYLGPKMFLTALVRSYKAKKRVVASAREAVERVEHIERLTKIVGAILYSRSSLCDSVAWGIYTALGNDPAQHYKGKPTICWEASIGIMATLAGRPAFGLGVEFAGDRLDIRQLQGAQDLVVGKSLEDWPKLLVGACMAFAQISGDIREVRVYKADQAPFYYSPLVYPKKGQTYEEVAQECRQRMRRRYDGTARRLGLKKEEDYYSWTNPEYAQPA